MKNMSHAYSLLLAILTLTTLFQEVQGAATNPSITKSDFENKLELTGNKLQELGTSLGGLHTKLDDLKKKFLSPSGPTKADAAVTLAIKTADSAMEAKATDKTKNLALTLLTKLVSTGASTELLNKAEALTQTTIESKDTNVILLSLELCKKLVESKINNYDSVINIANNATEPLNSMISLTETEQQISLAGLSLFAALVDKGEGIKQAIAKAEMAVEWGKTNLIKKTYEDVCIAGLELYKKLIQTIINVISSNRASFNTTQKKQLISELINSAKTAVQLAINANDINIQKNGNALQTILLALQENLNKKPL